MEVGERQKIVIQTLYCSQWQFLVCRRSSQIRGDLAAYRPYSIRTRIEKEVNLSFKQKMENEMSKIYSETIQLRVICSLFHALGQRERS